MSRADRIKAKLDLLKLLIIAILTALFGVVGFAVTHYKTLDFVLSLMVSLGIIVLLSALVYLSINFNKELDKLEKEK